MCPNHSVALSGASAAPINLDPTVILRPLLKLKTNGWQPVKQSLALIGSCSDPSRKNGIETVTDGAGRAAHRARCGPEELQPIITQLNWLPTR